MKIINLVVLVLLISLSGCATISGAAKHNVSNSPKLAVDGSGVTIGVWLSNDGEPIKDVIKACKAINDADPRCATPEKFRFGAVGSAFGFAAGLASSFTLLPLEMDIKSCVTGSSKCTYLKVKSEDNRFGDLIEVASIPGDGKCRWSGMPRAGGVVCPAYNWDYRKDLNDWDTFNGSMTVNAK